MSDNRTRENLAAYAHDAWSGWMNYLLSKSTVNADGTWTVPAWAAERWHRQMSTPYHLLPEDEKESDRAEADRMLAIVNATPQNGWQTIGHCTCDSPSRSVVFCGGDAVRCGHCGAPLTVTP